MTQDDCAFMSIAVAEAAKDTRPHKVGAVVVKDGVELGRAHGFEYSEQNHAEYTLLERKLPTTDLKGATLYTTLEPCTRRRHPEYSCAVWTKMRGISRVVIGLPDPNPDICHGGELFLRKHGIKVDYVPEFSKQIEDLMPEWIQQQRSRTTYPDFFRQLETRIDPRIRQYSGLAIDGNLTLCLCPDVTRGWLLSEVHLRHSTTTFVIAEQYASSYKQYFERSYEEKGFKVDNPKIMLNLNPASFTDKPDLILDTKETKYSHVRFYEDEIAADPAKNRLLIAELLHGAKRVVPFPNSLCMQLVVVTSDDKLLITRRAPGVDWYPNLWSVSIEEQMAIKDLQGGRGGAVLTWGKRAVFEELGITDKVYDDTNFRVLSVFLESEIVNIGLCANVVLNIPSGELSKIIRRLPRMDYEFTAWDYLDYEESELQTEILNPSAGLEYHPTSRYRMLMALIKKNGLPVDAERSFHG